MSRAKMIEFNSDEIWSGVRRKCRCSEVQVWERLAKRLEVNPNLVKNWFKNSRMPEAKFRVLTEYLEGNLPLRKDSSQICFDEVDEPIKVLIDGEEIDLPWDKNCSTQGFPAAEFFSEMCCRFAADHPETYMNCLKELIVFDSMGGRT